MSTHSVPQPQLAVYPPLTPTGYLGPQSIGTPSIPYNGQYSFQTSDGGQSYSSLIPAQNIVLPNGSSYSTMNIIFLILLICSCISCIANVITGSVLGVISPIISMIIIIILYYTMSYSVSQDMSI